MISHVSKQKSCHDWPLNEVHTVYMIRSSFSHGNRRITQGMGLTELEQGNILAYKDARMSIHHSAKKIIGSRKVISNFLRDPNYCVSNKKRGIRGKISKKAKSRLLRAASSQISSASKLKGPWN